MDQELPFWSWLIQQIARTLQWAMKWVWDHIRGIFEQLWNGFISSVGDFAWLPPLPDMTEVSAVVLAIDAAGFPIVLIANVLLAYFLWRSSMFTVRMTYVLIKMVRGAG